MPDLRTALLTALGSSSAYVQDLDAEGRAIAAEKGETYTGNQGVLVDGVIDPDKVVEALAFTKDDLARAIEHAVNFHNIDTRLGMPDFKIGELLADETMAWLRQETDAQIFERMSPEDRAAIGWDEGAP